MAEIPGGLLAFLIVFGIGAWWVLNGGKKKEEGSVFEFEKYLVNPNDARLETAGLLLKKIEDVGAAADKSVIHNGYVVGKVDRILVEKEKVGKSEKKVYYIAIKKGGGSLFFSKKERTIIIIGSEDSLIDGANAIILTRAPVPIIPNVYALDDIGMAAITRDSETALAGDIVAAMRMVLPELYTYMHPAVSSGIKIEEIRAGIEQAIAEEKIKRITS